MEKIKSARELAMERTADLKDTYQESPGSEYEPYFKASSLLADSFLKKQSTLERVIETISRYPDGARDEATRIFLEKIVAGMELEHCPVVASAFRHYRAAQESKLVDALEELDRKYREEVQELLAQAKDGQYAAQLLEPLHQAGISGSALAGVNLERSPRWQEKLSSLEAGFESQLALLKEQLLSALKNK
jgi:hypothetical protein